MIQWEYQSVMIGSSTLENELNSYGREGWEALLVQRETVTGTKMLMKRRKVVEEMPKPLPPPLGHLTIPEIVYDEKGFFTNVWVKDYRKGRGQIEPALVAGMNEDIIQYLAEMHKYCIYYIEEWYEKPTFDIEEESNDE